MSEDARAIGIVFVAAICLRVGLGETLGEAHAERERDRNRGESSDEYCELRERVSTSWRSSDRIEKSSR